MEHNPLIPFDGARPSSLPRTTQVPRHAGESKAFAPTPAYPPAYREPRSAFASVAATVLVGFFRGLGFLLVQILFWLRLPLLWILAVVARLTAIGAIASLLFWWLSARSAPIVVVTGFIALGINFACHLLLWLYDGFLARLSSDRF